LREISCKNLHALLKYQRKSRGLLLVGLLCIKTYVSSKITALGKHNMQTKPIWKKNIINELAIVHEHFVS